MIAIPVVGEHDYNTKCNVLSNKLKAMCMSDVPEVIRDPFYEVWPASATAEILMRGCDRIGPVWLLAIPIDDYNLEPRVFLRMLTDDYKNLDLSKADIKGYLESILGEELEQFRFMLKMDEIFKD